MCHNDGGRICPVRHVIFNSGEFKILDLFKDKPNSVDNWIQQKTAGTRQNSPLKPVPLKQALMGRLGNNLSGRRSGSIGKNEEKIKGQDGQTVTFVQPMLSTVDTSRRVEIVRLNNAETTDI